MDFPTPESRLILALDVADSAAAERLVRATEGVVGVYKIGLEFAMAGGLDFAAELARAGHRTFLDMKLLDIANTVAGGVRSAGALGATFLTVHAYPQALRAAVAARPDGLAIVAVTVLTSLDDADLREAGYAIGAADLVAQRIAGAAAAGADAIVCSPQEAAVAAASGLTVITPGIRMADDAAGDQKRIATPASAIAAGADALVVGRPINAAADPRAAAERYRDAIADALASA
ncbi:orotidine-5'-phosphate decarboxylase [Acuticoccus mangrovi]|uniref:Orotidine 5'-phosphate decarboxylase n=1 Tax=Acuticoccus mangrovi TaxID=2796142 RepID=A0A934IS76_9HYPH|nr:orotidine-5'-phosphate decarboxylase [Acuticoccus mangrovi]MBJ3777725.1 orotidine-5'-phosphate decarboxylase [Acuticoccus mangrovi]